jgi:hypothetical protein
VGATEQLVYRLAERASQAVPDGDVHAADRVRHGALLAERARQVVHALPQHVHVERVLPQDDGLECVLDDGGRDLGRLQAVAQGFTPADHAIVGQQLDQHGAALVDPAH